ncbi:MFS transporter [Amycolatopsis cihanbeyliensis]|uniref:EmrB/QacA subfamily drug resistance transporter n=1 Tax=Amycolatopsis cihanbeyliensis TaxID=1128664 RepID=A0A542DGI9_AMYCI|nr:MFS transporter [Amycolatopsis cihanbeyliensis]TQJ02195.1 EmrB/QacA subfamily drug resistance transporter [Amycolatopsis cihanbeyliensis]
MTSRQDACRDAAGVEPDPRRWKALAVTLVAGFMSLLDVSIVNVALPSIQRGLDATSGEVQWVVSGYALTFGLMLVSGGRLGDALGRRRMFLIALSSFVLTSALAGAAPDEATLVLARLLQGFAAGMLTPQNTGLIQDLFRGAERGKAFGLFGATVGISTAVGPVLGGLIIAGFGEQDGWRWVFFVNIPIGAVALLLAARLLPPAGPRRRRLRTEIDLLGMVLLGLAVLGVLLPLVQSEQGGLSRLWWMFPLAAVFGFAFVCWERHRVRRERPPLLDPRLFTRTPGYATGASLGAMYFCGFAGIWLVFALFFQQGLGYSPLESGLAVTPFAVGSAASAAVAGRLVARWRRRLTVTGLALVGIGLATVALIVLLVPADSEGAAVALPLLVAGIGGGMVISPNTTLTLERVPPELAGVAGGALQTGQRIGTAIGTAVLASVFHAVAAEGRFPAALSAAMLCAVAFVGCAFVLAVLELRREPHRSHAKITQKVTASSPFE